MPDDIEQQTETTVPATADEHDEHATATDADADDGASSGNDTDPDDKPQEGNAAEPFDAARAQAKIRKANQEAASLRRRLKELEPLAEEARQAKAAQQTEAERLQAQLAEREKEITQIRKRAVKSEVRSMAADLFADKTDPEAHLDLDAYVGDDGEIDTDQIKADLADLLERKPHLAKPKAEEPQQRRRPAPDKTQASGANQPRVKNPADEFAGFVQSRLLKGR
jgi:chromosome segregation ATPase